MSRFLLSQRVGNIKRAMRRSFEALSAQHDITATQFQVLLRLWNGDGLNAQTLAKEAHLDAATMTGVLDRLEAKGLVCREKDQNDRRAVRVVLTQQGRDLRAPLMEARAEINEMALTDFDELERNQLLALLERVEKNLESEAATKGEQ